MNLADFNDYFDAADTLAGSGHVAANAGHSSAGLSTSGDVLITDARYRRFSVGNVAANWQTTSRTVHATGSVQSDHGSIAITGDAYAATSVHLTASSVTVNGTTCTGGIDEMIVATSPSSQATATGTACGRSGVVPLP